MVCFQFLEPLAFLDKYTQFQLKVSLILFDIVYLNKQISYIILYFTQQSVIQTVIHSKEKL